MAIKLTLNPSERVLFCASKWWGDPDMPENMQYPTIQVCEDGEVYEYPVTFICQINCEDIAPYDKEGRLPHEGMLYFFAALDKWLGYDSPTSNDMGEWTRGHFVVKYAKSINFETFQSCMLVDDQDQTLTEREMEIVFSECDDNEKCIRLLGNPSSDTVSEKYPELSNLLQITRDTNLDLEFEGELNLLIKANDLKFCNWKKTLAHLN